MKSLDNYLTDGVLVEEYVMISNLLSSLRDFNTTLRWITLHRNCSNKKMRETVAPIVSKNQILLFLMKTAQFEFILKEMLHDLLDQFVFMLYISTFLFWFGFIMIYYFDTTFCGQERKSMEYV